MYQTPYQYGGNKGAMNKGYNQDLMGGGGFGGMGTGELRNFGYQPPSNARGPVRATDLGFNSNGGYAKQNYGN